MKISSPPLTLPYHPSPVAWMLGGAFSFALMAAATRLLHGHCPWAVVAFFRASITFISAAFIAGWSGMNVFRHCPPMLWVRSIAGSISLLCMFYSASHLPLADSITLFNLYPLWIMIITAFIARKLPSLAEAAAIASGLVGVVLLMHPSMSMDSFPYAVGLGGSFVASIAMLSLHRLKHLRTSQVVVHFSATSCIVALAFWVLTDTEPFGAGYTLPHTLGLLAAVGIAGTLGQFFITRAYAHGTPTVIGAIAITEVSFGVLLDVIFWQRVISPELLLGIALTILPIWLLRVKQAPVDKEIAVE